MLQIDNPDGAFQILERYLRDHGFFEPDADPSLRGHIYLGYGLSAPLRRHGAELPEEPCPLPLAACSIRAVRDELPVPGSFSVGSWSTTWLRHEYRNAIERAQLAIGRGDVYQVNLVQHLSAPFSGDARGLESALAGLRPLEPRALVGEGWAIVSASPELFLARRDNLIWTMPIKGTRSLDSGGQLTTSLKDRAEHVMIVDLERNDLARVCAAGTVGWPELMVERPLAGVSHMVSRVEGRLRPAIGFADLLEATFPGGSVTGAPKISAIDYIAALEPVGRGASMGAIGTVHPNGEFDLSLTIRTFAVSAGLAHLWVGGGIVADSDPNAEVDESWTKAQPLLDAVAAADGQTAGVAA